MRYITIKNTDIKVSRLAFGTASLHHIFSRKKRLNLLEDALMLGISHFDTSPYYGYGLSEIDLGLMSKGRRDHVSITTKIGLYPPVASSENIYSVWTRKTIGKAFSKIITPEVNWSINRAALSLETSLRRMDTDYVDFLFLHEPNFLLINSDEFLKWFEAVISQGKVRYVGIAGEPRTILPWLNKESAISRIIQTRDGHKESKVVDLMTDNGHAPQFTYGYISSSNAKNIDKVIKNASSRNSSGSIIVSTRKKERLADLANLG